MKIFTRTCYKIVGSDYSAQEPRMTAFLSDQFSASPSPYDGKPCGNKMKEAYLEKKDLYAMIAVSAFNNNYEDNLEFYPEGTRLTIDGKEVIAGNKTHKNVEGKARRSTGKVLNLAATYGMGGKAAGEKLGKSAEEGTKLLDNFFKGFPNVKLAIDYSKDFLRKTGYVEDFYGRRRHLPEINLPAYEIKYLDKEQDLKSTFNPFFNCEDLKIKDPLKQKWQEELDKAIDYNNSIRLTSARVLGREYTPSQDLPRKAFSELQSNAAKEGILIQANTGRIAQAERQCFNARIQGGAATLTKLAMVDISKDAILNKCQAHLIIPVHDELLVECPEYYSDIVEQRLPEVMVGAAKNGGINIPQACDPYNVYRWYADELGAAILEAFNKLVKSGVSSEEAFESVCKEHTELPTEAIHKVITGETEELIF